MKQKPAFTLIEMLVVIALIALMSSLGIFYLGNIRNKQALYASADELKTIINRAHIYSRESKDEKSWGIKTVGKETYQLISGNKGVYGIEREFKLESPTQFVGSDKDIWFDQGTGETKNNTNIILTNNKGKELKIEVTKAGFVNVKDK